MVQDVAVLAVAMILAYGSFFCFFSVVVAEIITMAAVVVTTAVSNHF